MNPDLHAALLTSNQCTCWIERIDEGNERLPRNIRFTNPDCPDHGENAARVLPDGGAA